MKTKDLHIGQMIKDFVKYRGLRPVDLANMIGKTRQNINDLYKRCDVEVKLLLTISEALNHNFFNDLYPDKSQPDVDKVFDALKEIVKQKMG